MKRGVLFTGLLSIVILWCIWNGQPLAVHAEIASDDAFEGVTWEKIIEDDIEGPRGRSVNVRDRRLYHLYRKF